VVAHDRRATCSMDDMRIGSNPPIRGPMGDIKQWLKSWGGALNASEIVAVQERWSCQ
jgi:hypothetical protein